MNTQIHKSYFSNQWLPLVLIVIAVVIIYSNIYHAPFVFDDERLSALGSHSSNDQAFKQKCFIAYLTFAVNHRLGGLNVVGYHIVNVLIHVLNGFLVYFLSLTIFKKLYTIPQSLNSKINLMSLFAALIFVAHPIQTQAVTYTVQRIASMGAMFYMASVFFYLKARIIVQVSSFKFQNKNYLIYYILSGLCGMLAFLCKPNTASLPGVILLVEYLLIDRTWISWRKIIPWYSLFFMLWIIFISYVSGLFSSELREENLLEGISSLSRVDGAMASRWQYLCTQFNVLVVYVRLLFLPIHQNLDYMYPFKSGFFDGYTPVAFLFLSGLVAIGVMNIRKRPIICMAIFWFFITLSVESSVIPIRNALYEHRLYLPMFGFAVFVSWLLFHFLFLNKPLWVIVACIVIILSLGTATYHRNGVWQDDLTLWSDVVSKSPRNYRAYTNVGVALAEEGRFDETTFYYKEALRIKPDYYVAHNNLGVTLAQQDKHEEAILYYKEALRLQPDYADAHNSLGATLARQDKHEEAISHYKETIRIKPYHADAHSNLGIALFKQGRPEEAIFHYKEALRIKPYHADAHNNLGIALHEEGKFNEAIFHYKEALRMKPNNADANSNLGNALLKQGRSEEAIFHYKEALRIEPDYFIAHNNLGVTLAQQDKHEEAILHYKEALKLQPDNADVHNSLGVALARQDKREEAMFHYKEAIRIKPNHAYAHNNLGIALFRQGRPEEAILHYKEALRLQPDYADALNSLGSALAQQGKHEEAILHYKEALRIEPESTNISNNLQKVLISLDNAKKHFDKGLALQLQGHLKEAIIHYKEALRIHPYDFKYYNNLSWVLATSKDPKYRDSTEAVKLAEKACELIGHKEPLALDTLAAAYAEAGRFDEASQTAQKAIEMAKSNGQQELAGVIEKRMQLYKSGRPFYEDAAQ